MILRRWFLCCFLVCLPLTAQTAPSPWAQAEHLKGQTILLRNVESGSKLSFDAQGKPLKIYPPDPFAYSAIEVSGVHHSSSELEIHGKRAALMYYSAPKSLAHGIITTVPLNEPVEITIAFDPSHPEYLASALRKIFALNMQDALSGKSPAEVTKALYTLAANAPLEKGSDSTHFPPTRYKPSDKGVVPPKLTYSIRPEMSEEEERYGKTGICLLSLIVDTSGRPTHIRVKRSLSYERDLSSVVAVIQYRFEPATYKGQPVAVPVDVSVRFARYR